MRVILRHFALLLFAVIPICGCTVKDGFDRKDFEASDVCLRVKGEDVFTYIPGSNQMAFNRGKKQFRAGTDTMSDYFIINFSSLPSGEGDVVTASLKWTTHDDIVTQNGLSFKVVEVSSDGKIWLWCARQRITVVMRMLD